MQAVSRRERGQLASRGLGAHSFLKSHKKLTLNLRDNLFTPLTLALACSARGIHFTYLGTGCIFTYDHKNTFTKVDDPNFFG